VAIGRTTRFSNWIHFRLSARLEGLACEQTGTDGDTALVLCNGNIVATYNNEDQQLDLSVRTYQVVQEGGEWLVCGTR
jgi:hypothetical protein